MRGGNKAFREQKKTRRAKNPGTPNMVPPPVKLMGDLKAWAAHHAHRKAYLKDWDSGRSVTRRSAYLLYVTLLISMDNATNDASGKIQELAEAVAEHAGIPLAPGTLEDENTVIIRA